MRFHGEVNIFEHRSLVVFLKLPCSHDEITLVNQNRIHQLCTYATLTSRM